MHNPHKEVSKEAFINYFFNEFDNQRAVVIDHWLYMSLMSMN